VFVENPAHLNLRFLLCERRRPDGAWQQARMSLERLAWRPMRKRRSHWHAGGRARVADEGVDRRSEFRAARNKRRRGSLQRLGDRRDFLSDLVGEPAPRSCPPAIWVSSGRLLIGSGVLQGCPPQMGVCRRPRRRPGGRLSPKWCPQGASPDKSGLPRCYT